VPPPFTAPPVFVVTSVAALAVGGSVLAAATLETVALALAAATAVSVALALVAATVGTAVLVVIADGLGAAAAGWLWPPQPASSRPVATTAAQLQVRGNIEKLRNDGLA